MKNLKQWFNNLSLREQGMLTLLLACGLSILGVFLVKNFRNTAGEKTRIEQRIKQQQTWKNNAVAIHSQLCVVAQKLTPEKAYDRTRMAGKIEELARGCNLRFSSETPQTRAGSVVDTHTLRLNVTHALLEDLIRFDTLLAQEAPYLGLESMKLTANPRFPLKLNATYQIVALQLKKIENLP